MKNFTHKGHALIRHTITELKHRLSYNPATGNFYWKSLPAKTTSAKVGDKAGSIQPTGYIRIVVDRFPYAAHRLAWAFTHEAWPIEEIDHINKMRDDNRIENLRCVTRAQNARNQYTNSDFPGVSWDAKNQKWRVRISTDEGRLSLGIYANKDTAIRIRKAAEKLFGYSVNHGGYNA